MTSAACLCLVSPCDPGLCHPSPIAASRNKRVQVVNQQWPSLRDAEFLPRGGRARIVSTHFCLPVCTLHIFFLFASSPFVCPRFFYGKAGTFFTFQPYGVTVEGVPALTVPIPMHSFSFVCVAVSMLVSFRLDFLWAYGLGSVTK